MKIKRFILGLFVFVGLGLLSSCNNNPTSKYGDVKVVNNGQLEGGTISLSKEGKLEVNSLVTISISLNKYYSLKSFTLNDNSISSSSFRVVEGDNIVGAIFEYNPPIFGNVILENDGIYEGGTISLSSKGEVLVDTLIYISVNVNKNYILDGLFLNGYKLESTTFNVTNGENKVSATFSKKDVIDEQKNLEINSSNFKTTGCIILNNVVENTSYPNEFTMNKNGSSIVSNYISKINKIEISVYGTYDNLTVYNKTTGGSLINANNIVDNPKYNNSKQYTYIFNEDNEFRIENSTNKNVYIFEIIIYYSGNISDDAPFIETIGLFDIRANTYNKYTKLETNLVNVNDNKIEIKPNGYIKAIGLYEVKEILLVNASNNISVYGIDNDLKESLLAIENNKAIIDVKYDGFVIKNETTSSALVEAISIKYELEDKRQIHDVTIEEAVSIALGLARNGGISEDLYRISGTITNVAGSQITISNGDSMIIAYSPIEIENMNLGYYVSVVGNLENYYYKAEIVNYKVESYVAKKYEITTLESENGTYIVSKLLDLNYGEEISLTATPISQDYVAYKASVNGRTYKFNGLDTIKIVVNDDLTISVEFKLKSEIDDFVLGTDKFYIHSLEMSGTYGDSNLISYGNFDILVDGGTASDSIPLSKMLKEYVVDGVLDLIVISHPDSDHYDGIANGGLSGVNEVKRLIVNSTHSGNNTVKNTVLNKSPSAIIEYASELTSSTNLVYTIDVDENFAINILYNTNYSGNGTNNASIPLLITYKNAKLFMAGDLEESGCNALMKTHPNLFSDSDFVIFKVLHHGSNGSNKTNFLSYLKPDFAFVNAPLKTVSNQTPNHSTHPYLQALIRVGEFTDRLYWAGICGLLTIECDGFNALCSGITRTRDYKIYDSNSNTYITVDKESESSLTYFQSSWYKDAIINQGAPDIANIMDN